MEAEVHGEDIWSKQASQQITLIPIESELF